MILAPLRGVTIRCFRETFAEPIRVAGFTEAITPFISALKGYDPLKDRELSKPSSASTAFLRLTPQFIGKDPLALRHCLQKIKDAGYETADLNCGCPYPMVRNKGRGSGLLRTPKVLQAMLAVGCEVMGPGKFSIKARLGIDRNDELLNLMPLINAFPLRFLTIHARNAKQMYDGSCDWDAVAQVERVSQVPVVRNGDLPVGSQGLVGRAFIRALADREDIHELLMRYIAASETELFGDHSVLGRMKELLAYWKDLPRWKPRWSVIKLCRSTEELRQVIA